MGTRQGFIEERTAHYNRVRALEMSKTEETGEALPVAI